MKQFIILHFFILYFCFLLGIKAIPTDPNINVTLNFGSANPTTINITPAMGFQNFRVCAGSLIRLEAISTGIGTLNYTWKEALTSTIIGSTNPLVAALPENQYYVIVSDNTGNIQSTIVIQICVETAPPTNPTITPSGTQTLCNSGTGTLTLTANAGSTTSNILCNTPNFTYQWFRNNVLINGQTNKTLVLTSSVANAGQYSVTISNACGSVTASPVTVLITNSSPQNPTITSSSGINEICPSQNITLNAAANGSVTLFEWYRIGNPSVIGTGNSFTTNISGQYKVRAINACGFTESSNFQVISTSVPNNININSLPNPPQNCSMVSLAPVVSGVTITKYEWFRDNVLVKTSHFPFPNGIGYQATTSGLYHVRASNACGTITSTQIHVTVIQPPTIATISSSPSAPSLTTNCVPNVTQIILQANTNGTGLLQYQWYLDGNMLVGENNSTLIATSAGTYYVEIFNECDFITSDDFEVVNVTASVPTNIILNSSINPPNSCTGSLTLYSNNFGAGTLYTWFKNNTIFTTTIVPQLVVTENGSFSLVVSNACGTSNISNSIVVNVAIPPIAPVLEAPNGNFTCNPTGQILLQMNSPQRPDVIYTWVKNNIEIPNPIFPNPLNISIGDSDSYTIKASNSCGTLYSNTITTRFLTPPVANAVSILYNPCDVPILLQGQSVGNFLEYKWELIDGVTNPIVSTQVNFNPNVSGTYVFSVRNDCLPNNIWYSSNPITINVNNTSLPIPTIVSIPTLGVDRICPNSQITLQVQLTGSTANLGYRWFRNNLLINGQTQNSILVNEGGIYTVEVFSTLNATCSKLSLPYNLFVRPTPTLLISYKGNLNFCEGDSVRLQAASQISPAEFRWKKDGNLLSSANFYIAKNSGIYQLEAVYNAGTLGYPCDLVVTREIDISTQIAPIPLIEAKNGLLQVKNKQISYQWNFNDVPIIGATDSTWLALDEGEYSVTVVNDVGCLGTSNKIYQKGIYPTKTPIIQLIPNPCEEDCGIVLMASGEMQWDILDINGKILTPNLQIQRRLSIAGQSSFVVKGLPKGIYIIRTQSKEGTNYAKLLVK
jgi:hypothetical protein